MPVPLEMAEDIDKTRQYAAARQDRNLDEAGHLIGAFPHRGWKRGLDYFPQRIEKDVWVLEIQTRHPDLPYGAFFEDLIS